MKLPQLSGLEVIKVLKKVGFQEQRQKGSHIILAKEIEGKNVGVVVPNHREVDKGTLLEIIRQAKMTREEFLNLL